MRFILVDEITDLDPGRTIRAVKTLRADEELFEDHFPGFPVVPGVLLIEMMAQAAGKCLDAEGRERGKAMLVKVNRAAFHKWVRPGERALIEGSIGTSTPAYATADCLVRVGEQRVASAELFFAFLGYGELAPDYRDEVLETYRARRASTGPIE